MMTVSDYNFELSLLSFAFLDFHVFFRHLKYTTVENSTIMSVEIEASKPAGISFNVSVALLLLSNTTNTGMLYICTKCTKKWNFQLE